MTRNASAYDRHWCPRRWALVAAATAALAGCGRPPVSGFDAGPPIGDASIGPGDAASGDATSDAGGPDHGPCVPVICGSGNALACSDCTDNDGDGLIDLDDHECTHTCEDSEDSLSVPGEAGDDTRVPCRSDCLFDSNGGSGDDKCLASHRCDPLEVAPRYDPEGSLCGYDPNLSICAPQSDACRTFCLPLTPNGCDCFGCCELVPGSGRYVWLNSADARGSYTCDTVADADDVDKCRPCTPVLDCLNPCEPGERCIGR